jgi:hypothetical protein
MESSMTVHFSLILFYARESSRCVFKGDFYDDNAHEANVTDDGMGMREIFFISPANINIMNHSILKWQVLMSVNKSLTLNKSHFSIQNPADNISDTISRYPTYISLWPCLWFEMLIRVSFLKCQPITMKFNKLMNYFKSSFRRQQSEV